MFNRAVRKARFNGLPIKAFLASSWSRLAPSESKRSMIQRVWIVIAIPRGGHITELCTPLYSPTERGRRCHMQRALYQNS